MATYDTLPVYKTSYDLLIGVFQVAKKFSREYKYTIGERLRMEIIELLTNIYRANGSSERRVHCIAAARENVELIRLYLRIVRDLREVDLEKFIELNLLIESVSKQLSGWHKTCYAKAGQSQGHHGVTERAV